MNTWKKTFFLNKLRELCVNLAAAGKTSEAVALAEKFSKNEERALAYWSMADKVYSQNSDPVAFVFLDSLYSKNRIIDFLKILAPLDYRSRLIILLSRIGSKRINNNALEILRDIPEGGKFNAIASRVIGISQEGNYYNAYMAIPATLTESQDLICRSCILLEDLRARDRSAGITEWKKI